VTDRGEVLWRPPADAFERTAMGRFATAAGHTTYGDLHRWSVADLDGFWSAIGDDVRWHDRPSAALADDRMPGAVWFPGGILNYAEHALAGGGGVVAVSQTRDPVTLTAGELRRQVAAAAAGLRRLGVTKGDRVAAYAPNIPETLVAMLATASIGAVWSSCAPEFGTRSVVDRFGQIEPTVLVAVDGYRYGDKVVDRTAEVEAIATALPTLRHTVGIRYLGTGADDWGALTSDDAELAVEPVAFDHPLYVLYSSGTTGLPKAIVHGHGGITVEHLKVLRLHHDLGPGEVFSWFTTTGWMMWNYLVSGLLVGATIVLFDGDPGFPTLDTLWQLASEVGVTVFGASAPFLMACRKAGITPPPGAVRQVGSTGAPLPADGFRWVSQSLGSDTQVNSISGGTDVCTAFVGMNPLTPVRAGEISGPVLGCDVAADGGELVVRRPMPSMPVGFWGDESGERYRAAYFEDRPGVWTHGDWFTVLDDDGACVITGRSDATLNRGGVRIGTADLYGVVEELTEVADSLVVHLDADGADELRLFVQLAPGATLDDDLRRRITTAIRTELSPRHVPDHIEAPVKRILSGTPADVAASRGSLADPGSLAWFEAAARR
jgi:acetoacetyl-CoA synthetase